MSLQFRIVLIVCALLAFIYFLRKIRKSEVTIADSIFWFLFALSLLLIAVFPQIIFFLCGLLGISSPANFVFLYVVAMLVLREFISTTEIAKLRAKISALTQERALIKTQTDNEEITRKE